MMQCTDLEHWSSIVCMRGSVPKVVGLHALIHQVPCLRQQAMPLHIHSMLLVPGCSRPANQAAHHMLYNSACLLIQQG